MRLESCTAGVLTFSWSSVACHSLFGYFVTQADWLHQLSRLMAGVSGSRALRNVSAETLKHGWGVTSGFSPTSTSPTRTSSSRSRLNCETRMVEFEVPNTRVLGSEGNLPCSCQEILITLRRHTSSMACPSTTDEDIGLGFYAIHPVQRHYLP